MSKDIKEVVQDCGKCQRYKNPGVRNPPIRMVGRKGLPFSHVCSDMMGPLPATMRGNTNLITFICATTKYAEVAPQKAATTINVANLLVDRIINRYGFPDTLLTEWG